MIFIKRKRTWILLLYINLLRSQKISRFSRKTWCFIAFSFFWYSIIIFFSTCARELCYGLTLLTAWVLASYTSNSLLTCLAIVVSTGNWCYSSDYMLSNLIQLIFDKFSYPYNQISFCLGITYCWTDLSGIKHLEWYMNWRKELWRKRYWIHEWKLLGKRSFLGIYECAKNVGNAQLSWGSVFLISEN